MSNNISKKVKDQYEENPYPRWRYLTNGFKSNFLNILNSNIKPNKVISENKFTKLGFNFIFMSSNIYITIFKFSLKFT